MDDAAELRRNSLSKHQTKPEYEDGQANERRDCRTRLETKIRGANGDREIFIFRAQLTTTRIGSLTQLILTFVIIHT